MKAKKFKVTKWAQLTAEERANIRLKKANTYACDRSSYYSNTDRLLGKLRPTFTKQEQRERNRYGQLLAYWHELYKKQKASQALKESL
jgi:hypothetical protein